MSELRRRNVLRMAVLYVVVAWLIMQVAEVVVTLAALPDWSGQVVLVVLVIGFPIALIFSWFYELTPEGIALEKDVDRAESITHLTGRRMDFIVISLLSAGLILFAYDKWWVPEPPPQSIAVLPFDNMSGDPDQEYFSDGLSDTLIHVLAQVSGLKVTAKNSSFKFKGKDIDVRDIAHDLGVGTVLEGSVQKSGDRVRIIAQLINADDGAHLWSDSYDRELNDIFAVQDDIAQEVVKALRTTLLDTEEERLAQRYKPTLEAYEQLVLGRYQLTRETAESLDSAEQHFRRAIELDPDYALPYVSLAETYTRQVLDGHLVFEEYMQRRQSLIDKALELDPLSGEAHLGRAILYSHQALKTGQDNYAAMTEGILKALELNPNYAEAHRRYSRLMSGQRRFEEALAQIRIAAELDPMSPSIQLSVAQSIWNTGHVEEALAQIQRNIERFPEYPGNYDRIADFETELGHLGAAQRWIQEARRRDPVDPYTRYRECVGFLNLGDVLSAEDCVGQLSVAHPEKVVSDGMWPMLHTYRGEWMPAIATLKPALERVRGYKPWVRWLADMTAGQGDVKRARRLMVDTFPELLEDGLDLAAPGLLEEGFETATDDLKAAVVFAAILHVTGEIQRRDVLLQAIEDRIANMHRIRGVGYGILDVFIHAIRGDRDRAIAGLHDAIDAGWRADSWDPLDDAWWTLRQDWKLANLHQDPEFIAMMNELEADIRKQRQWYEDHKDDPLF